MLVKLANQSIKFVQDIPIWSRNILLGVDEQDQVAAEKIDPLPDNSGVNNRHDIESVLSLQHRRPREALLHQRVHGCEDFSPKGLLFGLRCYKAAAGHKTSRVVYLLSCRPNSSVKTE